MDAQTVTRDDCIATARPLLARAIRDLLLPEAHLIDCARIANRMLDRAEAGDLSAVQAILGFLQALAPEGERHEAV